MKRTKTSALAAICMPIFLAGCEPEKIEAIVQPTTEQLAALAAEPDETYILLLDGRNNSEGQTHQFFNMVVKKAAKTTSNIVNTQGQEGTLNQATFVSILVQQDKDMSLKVRYDASGYRCYDTTYTDLASEQSKFGIPEETRQTVNGKTSSCGQWKLYARTLTYDAFTPTR